MKKNVLLVLVIFIYFSGFSQKKKTPKNLLNPDTKNLEKDYYSIKNGFNTIKSNKSYVIRQKKRFKKLSKPKTKNWLSKFLNKTLTLEDIEKLKYVTYLVRNKQNEEYTLVKKKNNIITISFFVNNDNIISEVFIKTGVKSLDLKLKKIFKSLPTKKLKLFKSNNVGSYFLQLFEYNDNLPFIKASTFPIKVNDYKNSKYMGVKSIEIIEPRHQF